MARTAMDALFAGVKWSCTACGKPAGTCDCWSDCECGHKRLRGEDCSNQVWHVAKQFAEEAADLIVADMAQGYKFFQREHIKARLRRTVIRHAQPIILATFEGVEEALRGAVETRDSGDTSTADKA